MGAGLVEVGVGHDFNQGWSGVGQGFGQCGWNVSALVTRIPRVPQRSANSAKFGLDNQFARLAYRRCAVLCDFPKLTIMQHNMGDIHFIFDGRGHFKAVLPKATVARDRDDLPFVASGGPGAHGGWKAEANGTKVAGH